MEIKQVKYFLNLADTLNFTRAAELSNVSQPALTKAVRKLEDELGGRLIFRDGKDTRLTELGRTIRSDFEAIVKSERQARQHAEVILGEKKAVLSIGVAATMGPFPILHFLEDFLKKETGTEIIITSINSGMASELVLSGALDACFCSNVAIANPKLQLVSLYHERLLLAVNRHHEFSNQQSVSLQSLQKETYIDRVKCEFRNMVIEHCRNKEVIMHPVLQSDREDWVQSAIGQNFGVSMVPEYSQLNDNIILRPVTGVDIAREVGLITIFGSPTSPATHRLRIAAEKYKWPI